MQGYRHYFLPTSRSCVVVRSTFGSPNTARGRNFCICAPSSSDHLQSGEICSSFLGWPWRNTSQHKVTAQVPTASHQEPALLVLENKGSESLLPSWMENAILSLYICLRYNHGYGNVPAKHLHQEVT